MRLAGFFVANAFLRDKSTVTEVRTRENERDNKREANTLKERWNYNKGNRARVVDGTRGGSYRITKRGPMVHGIQFYTSCARLHTQ